jgi:DNA-binding GntR family transcriptional regulator
MSRAHTIAAMAAPLPRATPLQVQLANAILDLAVASLESREPITEAQCAERLRVSRTPVRSALRLLAALGALQPQPRGYTVVSMAELQAARQALPRSGVEQLQRHLIDDYLDGVLRETVFENELVERYGASKGEVRAVLQRLAEQGVVARSRGHGWSFQGLLSGAQADLESYRLRLLIEPAGLVEPTFHLDRPRLEQVRAAHERLLNGADASAQELFELNASFHEALADMSGNRFFSQIIRQQSALRRLLEYRGYRDLARTRASLAEHLGMVDALLQGRQEEASTLMRTHLTSAIQRRLGTG